MLDKTLTNPAEASYKFVIITLDAHSAGPVSYTHLTLPTIYSV